MSNQHSKDLSCPSEPNTTATSSGKACRIASCPKKDDYRRKQIKVHRQWETRKRPQNRTQPGKCLSWQALHSCGVIHLRVLPRLMEGQTFPVTCLESEEGPFVPRLASSPSLDTQGHLIYLTTQTTFSLLVYFSHDGSWE